MSALAYGRPMRPIRLSVLAFLAAATATPYSRIRSQPMIHAMNSPKVA